MPGSGQTELSRMLQRIVSQSFPPKLVNDFFRKIGDKLLCFFPTLLHLMFFVASIVRGIIFSE